MDLIITDRLSRIEQCTSIAELMRVFHAACAEDGIVAQSYIHIPQIGTRSSTLPRSIESADFPAVWSETYIRNEWYKDDPIMQHAFKKAHAIWWCDVEKEHQQPKRHHNFFKTLNTLFPGDGLSIPTFGPINRIGYFVLSIGSHDRSLLRITKQEAQLYCQSVHVRFCQLASRQLELCDLSAREIETMKHVLKGLTTPNIAKKMNVSVHTVHTYLKRVFEKMGVNDRVSASLRFLTLGYPVL